MANKSSAFLRMLVLLDSVDTVTRASLALKAQTMFPIYGIKYTRLADALHSDGSSHWASMLTGLLTNSTLQKRRSLLHSTASNIDWRTWGSDTL